MRPSETIFKHVILEKKTLFSTLIDTNTHWQQRFSVVSCAVVRIMNTLQILQRFINNKSIFLLVNCWRFVVHSAASGSNILSPIVSNFLNPKVQLLYTTISTVAITKAPGPHTVSHFDSIQYSDSTILFTTIEQLRRTIEQCRIRLSSYDEKASELQERVNRLWRRNGVSFPEFPFCLPFQFCSICRNVCVIQASLVLPNGPFSPEFILSFSTSISRSLVFSYRIPCPCIPLLYQTQLVSANIAHIFSKHLCGWYCFDADQCT